MKHLLKESQFQKALRYFQGELKSLKYFNMSNLPSIIGIATDHGFKLDQDLIEAFKEAVGEEIWNGIEPEWASMEAYHWWDKMNPDYFAETGQSSRMSKKPDLVWAPGKKLSGKLIDNSGNQ